LFLLRIWLADRLRDRFCTRIASQQRDQRAILAAKLLWGVGPPVREYGSTEPYGTAAQQLAWPALPATCDLLCCCWPLALQLLPGSPAACLPLPLRSPSSCGSAV
jgi:hypothetical protein